MPAIAAIVIKDNANADTTFSPNGRSATGVTTYSDSNAVFDARRMLSTSLTLPKNGGKMIRSKHKIVIPQMDPVDTSLRVGESMVTIEFVTPKTSSAAHRLDLQKFAENFVKHAVVTAAVQAFDSVI